jgi:hypothetical protein
MYLRQAKERSTDNFHFPSSRLGAWAFIVIFVSSSVVQAGGIGGAPGYLPCGDGLIGSDGFCVNAAELLATLDRKRTTRSESEHPSKAETEVKAMISESIDTQLMKHECP